VGTYGQRIKRNDDDENGQCRMNLRWNGKSNRQELATIGHVPLHRANVSCAAFLNAIGLGMAHPHKMTHYTASLTQFANHWIESPSLIPQVRPGTEKGDG